jgi:phosphoinositide-3-kinase regulatory subunit 4
LFHNFFLHEEFSEALLLPILQVALTERAFPEILKQLTSTLSETGKNAKNKALNAEANEMAIPSSTNQSFVLSENFKGPFNWDRQSRKANIGQSYPELATDISALQRDLEQQNSRQGKNNVSDRVPMSNPVNFMIRKSENSLRRTSLEKENPSDSLQLNAEKTLTDKSFIYKRKLNNEDPPMVGSERSLDDAVMGPYSTNCEGMVLIASLLCSCLRSVTLTQSRRGAIMLLRRCSYYIDDEDRLQHVVPYVVAMLPDPAPIIRCAALLTICDVLSLVQAFPPSDAKIFPEYILPMLSMLPDDPEESVRICYAENIYKIAATASHFLIRSQSLNEMNILDRTHVSNKAVKVPVGPSQALGSQTPGYQQNSNCNAELAQLRQAIAHVIQDLVMGQKQTAIIRRALLQHVKELCDFFGEKHCNEFLLPILPAFLNDHDKQLQAVFFQQIIHVCYFVGQMSVEEYLLPYIEQALNDHVEEVIVNALKCLANLSKEKLLRKRLLLDAVKRAAPLLCHPSQWVRRSAVTFIAASSESLHPVDSHVYLSPILRPFLRREPTSLVSEIDFLSCLKSPMSRKDFHHVLEKVKNLQCSEISEKDNSQSKLGHISASAKTVGFVSSSSNTDVSSMPSAELMHRSLIMAGSFPPKIFTGSMLNGIFAAPKQVSKVIRNGAARTHMNEDTTLLDIVDKGFSLSVDQVAGSPSSSEAVMLSSYSRTSVPDGTWRPQGILVAHLQEHQLVSMILQFHMITIFL